ELLATDVPGSRRAAVGHSVFTADEAVEKAGHGKKKNPVILVRAETTPEDIHGMEVAKGILTSRGGMTSHAAVVTRGMGKCCVAGAEQITVDEKTRAMRVKGQVFREGDWISLDGTTGRVSDDKIRHMRAMILADNEKDRRAALKKLLPLQREDFAGVFKAMDGLPVTIRTLDPPLHEFLPRREDLMVEIATLRHANAKEKKAL